MLRLVLRCWSCDVNLCTCGDLSCQLLDSGLTATGIVYKPLLGYHRETQAWGRALGYLSEKYNFTIYPPTGPDPDYPDYPLGKSL